MNSLSDSLENSLLDHLLKATAYTPASDLYIALFVSDPGEVGATGEVPTSVSSVATGYARAKVTNNATNFPACSISGNPIKTNGVTITFPTATTAWGSVGYWAIYDSSTGTTNMLIHGELSTLRYVAADDSPKIPASSMAISFLGGTSGTGSMSNYTKQKLLDHVFGKYTFTPPSAVYAGFGTALSGDAITELAQTNYSRKPAGFGTAVGGLTSNAGPIVFTTEYAGEDANLTHFGIWDDSNSGNLLVAGPLGVARTVKQYDTLKINSSALTVTLQ